jgi:hypothetical protein
MGKGQGYVGKVKNRGAQKVEAVFSQDGKPKGVVSQKGGDLRAKASQVKN